MNTVSEIRHALAMISVDLIKRGAITINDIKNERQKTIVQSILDAEEMEESQ